MTLSHSAEKSSSENNLSQSRSRSLFSIGEDLERLNEILDEAGDDTQQQELLNEWLQQLGTERDRKLDGYAALISEIQARAEARKAEAQRLMELVRADERRSQLLKERLKWFFESQQLKTIETTRYRLSLSKNGGKAPLILKPDLSPQQLPERFTTTSIEPNTSAIRAALEAGESLDFASLGDRGTSIRIK
ncbi:siphovirus Gp157 family protein [Chroococcidiopsis sp. FACHB-1243]|uniref:siphovirus Gp157 family protein n=1 Tax=Chroococcidiopsis sp. [FACHB-1243] TaxID=2692781 RepID=UPI0018F027F5